MTLDGRDDLLRIMFTGDVHLGPAYHGSGVFDTELQQACQRSDYVVFNMEGPITSSPPRRMPGGTICSHPGSSAVLKTLGNGVLGLANNHTFDHGVTGLMDTIKVAEDLGWPHLGAGENIDKASSPCVLSHGNVMAGILAVCNKGTFAGQFTPGVFGDTNELLLQTRIQELKQRVNWVVVLYHGGEEDTHIPMPPRRRRFLHYLEYGADVIVAHHAHCVQGYEQIGAKYLFYGLGNCVFDFEGHGRIKGTDESTLLSLSFSESAITFAPIFTRQNRKTCVVEKSETNRHFVPIFAESYRHEWGKEASRWLSMSWDLRRVGLPSHGWRRPLAYFWKSVRRVAGLTKGLITDRDVRPIIIGAVFYRARHVWSLLFRYR